MKSECQTDEDGIYWYKDEKLHNEKSPAIIRSDGTREWWKEGRKHRVGGPAIEWADGSGLWFFEGVFHNLDGPALTSAKGSQEWYIHGKKLSEELFDKLTKGPAEDLPLYIGQGFDEFITKRLKV